MIGPQPGNLTRDTGNPQTGIGNKQREEDWCYDETGNWQKHDYDGPEDPSEDVNQTRNNRWRAVEEYENAGTSPERRYLDAGEHALFLSGYGARFNAKYLGNWVTRPIKAAEIGKTGSCHIPRHSCSQHMLDGGADIRFIQQLLGHARLDSTQINTEVGVKALREANRRTHPAAKAQDNPPESC